MKNAKFVYLLPMLKYKINLNGQNMHLKTRNSEIICKIKFCYLIYYLYITKSIFILLSYFYDDPTHKHANPIKSELS